MILRESLCLLLLTALCGAPDRRPCRPGARRRDDPDIAVSHSDRVYAAEQFSNTVSVTDPADNFAARGDPPRRAAAGQSEPALSGRGAGARHGLFARRQDAGGGLDRYPIPSASSTRRPIPSSTRPMSAAPARGVLHARRQRSLGHGARRGLCCRARRQQLRREDAHHGAGRAGHADLFARRQIWLCLFVVHARNRGDLGRRPFRSSAGAAGQPVLPPTSQRRRTARRSGLR